MKKTADFAKDALLILTSGLIGWVGLSGSIRLATLVLAIPIFWTLAGSRYTAFAVMLIYKLAASRGLLPGAAVFLSEDHTILQAGLLYFLLSFGASLPFLTFWAGERKKRAICLLLAFTTAYVVPPLSLIGIVNPLIATGTIFRGWGFVGISVMMTIYILCARSGRAAILSLCLIAVFAVLSNEGWYESPEARGFLAINTSFGRLGSGSFNFAKDYERARMIFSDLRRRRIRESEAAFIVLPETIAGRLNESGMELWGQEAQTLLGNEMALVFGAELPTGDGRKYDNAAILLYRGNVEIARQRIPVPYSMYRGPWTTTGANLRLFENGIIRLPDGRKAAMIICYEAYLTWPWLVSMVQKPDVLLSIANLWWGRNTSLPVTQQNVVALWGLLFGVPVVFAENR